MNAAESRRVGNALCRLALSRAKKNGIGEAAHYSSIAQTQHPAEITSIIVADLAARRRQSTKAAR